MRQPHENDVEKRQNASKMRRTYENDVKKRRNASKMRRTHENDIKKRQNVSKIIKMSKFAKILIDALVAIFGIYGVDFPP